MKDDAPVPDTIPRKRRVLEDQGVTLDRFIAVWLARDDLTPSERRRLEQEKARRKTLHPDVIVGFIVGPEGVTPDQLGFVEQYLRTTEPTGIVHAGVSRKMLGVFPEVPVSMEADYKGIVRAATTVIAAPKEPEKPDRVEGVWEAVRYAKHRKVPVKVVLPNGDER